MDQAFNDKIKLFSDAILMPNAAIFLLSLIYPIKPVIGVFELHHHPLGYHTPSAFPARSLSIQRHDAAVESDAILFRLLYSATENRMELARFIRVASNM